MPYLPSISVITPSLNQGDFIAQTIESVRTQKYPALEHIVIDGGSTDHTLDILRRYGGSLRWISEPDAGQSAAINKGWQMADGEILAWLNSDDLLKPAAIQTVAETFQNNPKIVMVYGESDYINNSGEMVGKYDTRPWNYLNFLRNAVNFLPQPSVFIRRQTLAQTGWLDESLHYLMDYDLFLRVGGEGEVAQLPFTLSAMRLHANAKSLSALKGFSSEMPKVMGRIFESGKLPANLSSCRQEAMRNAYLYAASTAYWGGEPKEARAWLAKCWQYISWPNVPKSFLKLSLLSTFGEPGLTWANRWPGNPFTRTLTKDDRRS